MPSEERKVLEEAGQEKIEFTPESTFNRRSVTN